MTKQVQRRRGTATQHTSFTGAEGELSVNTTNKSVHVHDGSTAGGLELARKDGSNVAFTSGTLDGVTIGGTTAGAGTFTNLTATGTTTLAGASTSANITFGDNDKAIFGAGSDLQIYHDGSDSYVEDTGTGFLKLKGDVIHAGLGNQGFIDFLRSHYTAGTDGLRVGVGSSNQHEIKSLSNSPLQFGTNNSERMRIDTNGNVGIGTSSPSTRLHTDVTGGDNELRIATTTSGDPTLALYANGAGAHAIAFDRSDLALTFTTVGSSERMRIDANGRVGIGTSSPETIIHATASSAIIRLTSDTNGTSGVDFGDSADTNIGRILYDNSDNSMRFTTNASEAVRIGSTGTVTVGKTAEDIGTAGHAFAAQGYAFHTRDGNTPLFINRKTSDGTLVDFRKDNTTVGSIGTNSGNIYLTDGARSLIVDGSVVKAGYSTGGDADNAQDLGESGTRWKDLYLSGTAYVDTALDVDGTIKLDGNYPTGTSNVALGNTALDSTDGTANYNVAIGDAALTALTTGDNNVAVGYIALQDATTASANTAIGAAALGDATTGGNNVAVGRSAMRVNTTGANNVANGYAALYSNTTGANNVANGYAALYSNTTGSRNTALGSTALYNTVYSSNGNNTAVGFQAGYYNTTGINNTALGADALINNTTASNNTAVGASALTSNTTGIQNVAIGTSALLANTTANYNTATGHEALNSNTTGNNNTATGRRALYLNTEGARNTALGFEALRDNTEGDDNAATGYRALTDNTTGIRNSAHGTQALNANTTGSDNVAIGYRALFANTTGDSNVASGYQAGDAITTGARNVIFGSLADPSAASGNDQVVIGYSLTGKGDDTAFIGGTNGAYNEKNVTTWETTSDQRIKKNIVDNNDGLSVLSQIQVRNFEYRTPDEITDLPSHAAIEQEGVQLGVIAQEIQQVLPECVSENSTGVLSVNTDPLVWHLINAVKELKAEIEQLKGN